MSEQVYLAIFFMQNTQSPQSPLYEAHAIVRSGTGVACVREGNQRLRNEGYIGKRRILDKWLYSVSRNFSFDLQKLLTIATDHDGVGDNRSSVNEYFQPERQFVVTECFPVHSNITVMVC